MAEAENVAEAWRALGRHLAASRRAAGLSQARLAVLADYSRSTVANTETGRQRVPRDFWANCDKALGTGNALVRGYDEVAAIARRSRLHAAASAQQARAIMTSPARTGAGGPFGDGAADTGDGQRGLDPMESVRRRLSEAAGEGAVNGERLDAWEQAVSHHGQATRYRPAGELLIDLGADMAELDLAIRCARTAGPLRRLTRVAAQMAGLMCLLLVRLDQPGASGRWACTARAAAGEAGDAATLSWVLAQEAYGRYYNGDLTGAVNLARHAQDLLRRTPSVGAALAAALEARAQAARHDARQGRAALGRAETILAALDPSSVTASAFGYTESQLRFHEGSACTRLGDTRSALKAQERALRLCRPGDYTGWALIRLDTAACLAHDGDPAMAVAYATETLTQLSGGQGQGIIARRGRELVRSLPVRYRAGPAAGELEELLRAGAAQETP